MEYAPGLQANEGGNIAKVHGIGNMVSLTPSYDSEVPFRLCHFDRCPRGGEEKRKIT